MIRYIRKIPVINKIVRNLIIISSKYIIFLEKKWRLSGIIKLNFDNLIFFMYSKCDDGIIEPLYYNSSYIESNDLKVFTKFIGVKSVIFDVGANTGIYSLISGIVSKDAMIYSFEPNPINLIRLKKNIKLNSIKNITVVPKAVGSKKKKISFTIPEKDIISDTSSAIESFSKSSYKGEIQWKNIEVEQITIDSYCDNNKIQNLHMIKIDVEGYELSVLEGAKNIIKIHRPLILIETFLNKEKLTYLQNFVKDYDYYIYLISSEGIIKIGQKFENNIGLNYLLLSYETDNIFTSINELKTLYNTQYKKLG